MTKIRTLSLIMVVLLLMVFGAGCASKDTGSSVDVQDDNEKDSAIDTSEEVAPQEQAEAGLLKDEEEETEAEGSAELYDSTQRAGTAKEIYPDANIDPELEKTLVIAHNKDIVLKELKLISNRDFKESDDWEIRALIKNEADCPAYMKAFLSSGDRKATTRDGYRSYGYLIPYESGDTIELTLNAKGTGAVIDDYFVPVIEIDGVRRGVPKISPEFSNLKDVTGCAQNIGLVQMVIVNSVSYSSSEENADWKVIRIEMTGGATSAQTQVILTGEDGKGLKYEGEKKIIMVPFSIGEWESKTVEISLRSIPPEAIYGVVIGR